MNSYRVIAYVCVECGRPLYTFQFAKKPKGSFSIVDFIQWRIGRVATKSHRLIAAGEKQREVEK